MTYFDCSFLICSSDTKTVHLAAVANFRVVCRSRLWPSLSRSICEISNSRRKFDETSIPSPSNGINITTFRGMVVVCRPFVMVRIDCMSTFVSGVVLNCQMNVSPTIRDRVLAARLVRVTSLGGRFTQDIVVIDCVVLCVT